MISVSFDKTQVMPEELCRKCGEPLYEFAFCVRCHQLIQQMCNVCKRKTEEQFHDRCLYQLQVLKLFPIPPDNKIKDGLKMMDLIVHFQQNKKL